MKEIYQEPDMEIHEFEAADVIATSFMDDGSIPEWIARVNECAFDFDAWGGVLN